MPSTEWADLLADMAMDLKTLIALADLKEDFVLGAKCEDVRIAILERLANSQN